MRGALAPQQLRAALRRCAGAPTHARALSALRSRAAPLPGAATRAAPPPPRRCAARGSARTLAAAAGDTTAAGVPPPPDVAKLALMARLDVTPEEAAAWSPKINAIVDWCAAVQRKTHAKRSARSACIAQNPGEAHAHVLTRAR
jgi:hypothetical protein